MPEPNLADIKGRLSAVGAQLDPDARLVTVARPVLGARVGVVVLERVVDVVGAPEYCVHGFASCTRCEEMCYLGDQTLEAVLRPDVFAMCWQCARTVVAPEQRQDVERLTDHRPGDSRG